MMEPDKKRNLICFNAKQAGDYFSGRVKKIINKKEWASEFQINFAGEFAVKGLTTINVYDELVHSIKIINLACSAEVVKFIQIFH